MTEHRSLAAGLALMVVGGGCGNDSGRSVAPGPTGTRTTVQLEIDGPSSIAPGTSAQFVATAIGADGSRREVTNQVTWNLGNTAALSVSPGGLVTAHTVGRATLTAVTDGVLDTLDLVAVPDGTYMLRGQVVPVLGLLRPLVEVVDGPYRGTTAEGDVTGAYTLFGVAGRLQVRASLGGHVAETRELVVSAHTEANFTLAPATTTTVAGPWTLRLVVPDSCPPSLQAVSPLTAEIFIEGDGPGPISAIGEGLEGPARFNADITGGAFTLYLRYPDWDYSGPLWLRFRSPSGGVVDVGGEYVATRSSGTTFDGVVEGTLLGGGGDSAPYCTLQRHRMEMRRR